MSRKIIIPRGLVEDPNQSSVIEVSPRLNQTTGNLIARRQGGRLVAQQLPDWQDSYSSHRGLDNTFVATPLGCRPDQASNIPNPNVTFDVSENNSEYITANSTDPSAQHSLACYNTPLSDTPSRAEFNVTSDDLNLSSISESNVEMSDVMVASILNQTRQNQPRGNMDDVRRRLFTDSDNLQQQPSRRRAGDGSKSSRSRPPGDRRSCNCSKEDSMYSDFQPLASSSGIDLTRSHDISSPRSSNRTNQPRATPRSNQTYTVQAPRNVTRTIHPGRNQTYTVQGDLNRSTTVGPNQTYICPGNILQPEANQTYGIPETENFTQPITPRGNQTYAVQAPRNITRTVHPANQTYGIPAGNLPRSNQTYTCPGNTTHRQPGADQSYGIPLPQTVSPPVRSNQTYTVQQTPGNITRTIQPGRNQTYTVQGNSSSRSATFPSNQTSGMHQTYNVLSRRRHPPSVIQTLPSSVPRCARTGLDHDDRSNNITDLPTDDSYDFNFRPQFSSSQRSYSTLYDSSDVSFDLIDGSFPQPNASPCPCASGEQEAPPRHHRTYTVPPKVAGRLPRSPLGRDSSSRSADLTFNPPLSSTQRFGPTMYDSSEREGHDVSPCSCGVIQHNERRSRNRRQDTYSIPPNRSGQFASSIENSSDRQTSRVDECGCSPPGADSIVSYSSHVVEDVQEED